MSVPATPFSSSDDITFSTVRRGFDRAEVETFVDQVKETIIGLERVNADLEQRLTSIEDPARLESLERERSQLELENASLRSEMDALRTEVTALRDSDLADLRAALDGLKSRLETPVDETETTATNEPAGEPSIESDGETGAVFGRRTRDGSPTSVDGAYGGGFADAGRDPHAVIDAVSKLRRLWVTD